MKDHFFHQHLQQSWTSCAKIFAAHADEKWSSIQTMEESLFPVWSRTSDYRCK